MAIKNLTLRILAAGLPLVVIALVAGAAGYFTKSAEPAPIPPLSLSQPSTGIQGAIQSYAGDELTIATNDGTQVTFNLPSDSTIEQLTPISRSDLSLGDWINGGAIPHQRTLLVLVGMVLITDPVIQTP